MSKQTKIVAGTVVGLIVIALLVMRVFTRGPSADPRRLSAPLVKVERPTRETVSITLQFTGDVLPVQQAGIYSKGSGTLEKVYVDMGTPVRAGQLLALIDTTELHQQYQQAAATYQNAQLTHGRTKELFDQNLVARQDVDNAEAAMIVARAAYDNAATRLSYARITAPFAGTITRRFLDPGAVVTPSNATLFTLMDLDAMKITINVLEKDIPKIKDGMKAKITVDAFPGKEFMGAVTRFSEAVDLSTRTMAVEIDIPNPAHVLKPGMFANATLLVTEHRNALVVPTSAVLRDNDGTYLYIAVSDTARRVPLTLGVEQADRTEVLAGLGGEESVITVGQQLVRANSPVSIQQ